MAATKVEPILTLAATRVEEMKVEMRNPRYWRHLPALVILHVSPSLSASVREQETSMSPRVPRARFTKRLPQINDPLVPEQETIAVSLHPR